MSKISDKQKWGRQEGATKVEVGKLDISWGKRAVWSGAFKKYSRGTMKHKGRWNGFGLQGGLTE